ncbi:hypothetical protein [uncultured Microbacterium sp.]|uniref:NAD(P)-dependent oxidoreductase n=1 Tax=uncultured Microbacterium sp. TaxID=191216 RepID=UPI0032B1644E
MVVSVPARGDMLGRVQPGVEHLLALLPGHVRLGVIGGAGGSLVAPGGVRVIDDGFPEAFRAEALEAIDILELLRGADGARDWFLIHPARGFGAWNPGERTGSYRDGGDVVVTDQNGVSFISADDLAVAVLDEIETPRHRRERFSVGY